MKFKYLIIMIITSLISMGSMFWLTRAGAQTLNTNFTLETIRGDASLLKEFEISTTIRFKRGAIL